MMLRLNRISSKRAVLSIGDSSFLFMSGKLVAMKTPVYYGALAADDIKLRRIQLRVEEWAEGTPVTFISRALLECSLTANIPTVEEILDV